MKTFNVTEKTTWSMELQLNSDEKYSVRWLVITSGTTGYSVCALKVFKNGEELSHDDSFGVKLLRTARYLRLEQLKDDYDQLKNLDNLFGGGFYRDTMLSLIQRSFTQEYVGQSAGTHLTVQDVAGFFSATAESMYEDFHKLASENSTFTILDDIIIPSD